MEMVYLRWTIHSNGQITSRWQTRRNSSWKGVAQRSVMIRSGRYLQPGLVNTGIKVLPISKW